MLLIDWITYALAFVALFLLSQKALNAACSLLFPPPGPSLEEAVKAHLDRHEKKEAR